MSDRKGKHTPDQDYLAVLRLLIAQGTVLQMVGDRYEELLAQTQTLEAALQQQKQQTLIEAQLRQQSEEKFTHTFHSAPNPIVIVTFDEGRFVEVNQSFCRVFGYDRTEVIGRTALEIDIWGSLEERQLVRQQLQEIGSIYNIECSARTQSGVIRTVLLSAEQIQLGRSSCILCAFNDITERKEMEEQLRCKERLLSQTQKIAQVGGWEINLETDEVIWTEHTYQIHELPIGKLPPLPDLMELYTPESLPLVHRSLQAAIKNGEPFDIEAQITTANGNHLWVRVIGQPYYHNGRVVRVSGSCQNISDRKQTDELLRQAKETVDIANRVKADFLANMSHELRTPLTSIIGLSEVLQEGTFGSLNERQQKYVSIIAQSGKHLLELINDLLDLSKIEAGRLELQFALTDLQQLCADSLATVRQQAQQKQITLNLQIFQPSALVILDERRIRQVLINLLSNAVKFTPPGGSVTVQSQIDSANATLHISVSDTGIGIADVNMDELFQPFVQLDSSHSRQYAGTGLGLALVKKIVELHNGSISLESEVDRGSCFTISLPLKWADLSEADVFRLKPSNGIGSV